MSVLRLEDGREIEITEALGRRLEAAAIDSVSTAAQIVDDEFSPALLLIAGGALVFVTRNGTRRWNPSEVRRVEDTDIVPVNGAPVTFAGWRDTSERADFLRAVSRLVPTSPAPPAGSLAPVAAAVPELQEDPIARIIARFADGFVAMLSCVAFIAAASSAPDKSVCDLPAGPLFGTFTWVSGLGFLTAAVLALACRKSTGAKIACAGGLVLAAGLGTIFLGLSDMNIHEGQGRTRQDTLRLVVQEGGGHAYWLGSKFHGAQPSWVQDGRTQLWSVSYSYVDGTSTVVTVEDPDANPSADYGKRSHLNVIVAGRAVELTANGQTAADRAILREARAKLEPIPPNVTVSGCN